MGESQCSMLENQRFEKKGGGFSLKKSAFSKKKRGIFFSKMSVNRGCFSDWGTLICPT